MSKKSKKSSSLESLRKLVDNLTDRDVQIKRDFRLFESFLENFPIPVTMWSANLDGLVLNKKDRGFFCKTGDKIEDLFSCESLADTVFKKHKEALSGEPNSTLIQKMEKTFYVTVAPRHDNDNIVIGVSGIAWDVSSNSFILDTLIDIKNVTETKSGTFEEINEKASKAIEKSRLFLLAKEGK
jgi:hypothetical protein